MAGTLNVGANKIFIFENTSEIATYTIDSASIFPTGFELLDIKVQIQATGGVGALMQIAKGATNVLHGANVSTATLGVQNAELSRTSANLNFTGAEDLVISTVDVASQCRVTITVCESEPRSVTVS